MELLTREAFQSETEAKGKWRRVQLSSVQLTFYFAGFSAIYDYRQRLKDELGPRFDLKKFHEKFLSYGRSEERRVGKECGSTCKSRWAPVHSKKKKTKKT